MGRRSRTTEKRGPWVGNACLDRQVIDVLKRRGPFTDDQPAARFFGVDAAKARHVYASLERGVKDGSIKKRPNPKNNLSIYVLA